jgi:methanogenic corrinoid protein MtbC1
MALDSISRRFSLAQKIQSVKLTVAQAMTDEFFLLHPDWAVRYGERGRQFCTADACFHLEFLAGAIQAGSPEAFADYAAWTARMLGARGIDAHTLEENLAQLEKHLAPVLPAAGRQEVAAFLAKGRQACAQSQAASAAQAPDAALGLTRNAFAAAIVGGDRQAALGIAEEALRTGSHHVDIYVDVIGEALRSVGALWEENRISVAQEHLATAITQYVIAMIFPRLVPTAPSRGNMVVTGVAGEQHQIGANLVADAMESSGWGVRFLGTNLPHSTILGVVEGIAADVLCISTTLVANLPAAADLVREVHARLGARAPRIVLGGAAFRLTPSFALEIGSPTETIPDLRQALALLCA